ncbi:Abi family protein [Romboutsia ilealis]|uniref:Abi family protein n=1 Tax=Romboutsia ilealis TaxID=1115758 RepID=UPI00249480DB|nr:Abi family protein [Romboutsia ilealis]
MNTNKDKKLKDFKSLDEQIDLLEKRGLIIYNKDKAKRFLTNTNYYRFSGYYKPFYIKDTEQFKEKTTFNDIYNLYNFDRELRNLIFSLTEQVEIKFKTWIAYYISENYGNQGHLEKELFKNEIDYYMLMGQLGGELKKSKEDFIDHHNKIYSGNIPTWVIIEILSFGAISKLYKNLLITHKKGIIKNKTIYNYEFIESWLQTITILRNMCAHHSRLYNRSLMKPKIPRQLNGQYIQGKENKLFVQLLILRELIDDEYEWIDFVRKLDMLFYKYKFQREFEMGFPYNWKKQLLGESITKYTVKTRMFIK